MRYTNKTEYVILGLLTIKPMSGYDMKAFISESLDFFWSASYGQLYPTLKVLLKNGYVDKSVQSGKGKPSRHVYRITKIGRKKLKNWLTLEIKPEPIRNELLLKLFFGSNANKSDLKQHVRLCCEQQEERLKTFRHIEKEVFKGLEKSTEVVLWKSTLNYGIHITRARIKWCKETLSLLESNR